MASVAGAGADSHRLNVAIANAQTRSGATPGHWSSSYPGRGRKWMAILAESAARTLPERRMNGTPFHRGLFTWSVRQA
jgi:hypothetical protein